MPPPVLTMVSQGLTRGLTEYFLTDHRGNVIATVSDKKIAVDTDGDGYIDYYKADVVTSTDYSPFGSILAGRSYRNNGQQQQYGYNGKENDNEIKGEGNQQDYGMRIYDPRLGRFLSVDPLAPNYPELTPYQFASNRPIDGIDLDGLEFFSAFKAIQEWVDPKSKTSNDRGYVYGLLRNTTADGIVDQFTTSVIAAIKAPAPPKPTFKQAAQKVLEEAAGGPAWSIAKGLYRQGKSAIVDKNKQAAGEFTGSILSIVVPAALEMNAVKGELAAAKASTYENYGSEFLDDGLRMTEQPLGISKGFGVPFGGKTVPVYRGGNTFTLKPGEFKINPENGLVKTTHGISLDVNSRTASKFGGAYQIESIPEGLKIIQRGGRVEHFEIVPSYEMSVDKMQSLLNQIKTIPAK